MPRLAAVYKQVTRCCRFKLADDDVNKTSMTSAGADVTDDVSALAVDDDSSMLTARKSSHHGYYFCFTIFTTDVVVA